MRSYVICTILFSEKKESSIRTSKYAEEDQTENVILRSLKILLLKCVHIQRPQSFKRNVFHWENIPVMNIVVTIDSYWSLSRLSFMLLLGSADTYKCIWIEEKTWIDVQQLVLFRFSSSTRKRTTGYIQWCNITTFTHLL